MSARKGKNKAKGQPKRMSLRDRLDKHWGAGNWDAFVSLYLRDKAASDATPWKERYLDGLYNLLTKSLFLDRSPETARDIARLLLETSDSTADGGRSSSREWDETARDCARVALYFLALRETGQAEAAPLSHEDSLPEPWRTLRADLFKAAGGPRKRGRKKKTEVPDSPSGVLTQKLADQFRALPRARNLRAYTSFLQTAEALEKETAGQAGAGNFQAVRAIAGLLRELGGPKRGGDSLRDPCNLAQNKMINSIPAGADHPAVLGLWNYFCEEGGKKFGRDWEAAARILRLGFDRSQPLLAGAWQYLLNLEKGIPLSVCLHAVYVKYPDWSEPERYLLRTVFCAALQHDGPGAMFSLGSGAVVKNLEALTELGRRWRPSSPWPGAVQGLFELLVRSRGREFLKTVKFDPPYESLTGLTLLLMAAASPGLTETIAAAAASRLPLKLSQGDLEALGFDFSRLDPAPNRAAVVNLQKLLPAGSLAGLLRAWVESAVESSAVNAAAHGDKPNSAWDRFEPGLLELIAETLPEDDPAGIFVRLCLGRPRRTLPDDPKALAALTKAMARLQKPPPKKKRTAFFDFMDGPEIQLDDGFAANLFILLTVWPQADLDFMAELFRLGQRFLFDQTDLWRNAVTAVGLIKDAGRRQALAKGLSAVLKQVSDPDRREARRCFDNIQKGRKANPNVKKSIDPFEMMFGEISDDFDGDVGDGFEADMMKKFERFMGRINRRKKN